MSYSRSGVIPGKTQAQAVTLGPTLPLVGHESVSSGCRLSPHPQGGCGWLVQRGSHRPPPKALVCPAVRLYAHFAQPRAQAFSSLNTPRHPFRPRTVPNIVLRIHPINE